MFPNFVIIDGEGWFEYTCTGCGSEIRFGPYNGAKGTEQFQQAQLMAQEDYWAERWSSTSKCPRCQAKRRARQSPGAIIRRHYLTSIDRHRISIPRMPRKQFRLARERYPVIDDELHDAAAYFQHLAAEIDTSAVATNKHSQIWERVEVIRKEIGQLRRDLEQARSQQGAA
jgi:hypothetical protein